MEIRFGHGVDTGCGEGNFYEFGGDADFGIVLLHFGVDGDTGRKHKGVEVARKSKLADECLLLLVMCPMGTQGTEALLRHLWHRGRLLGSLWLRRLGCYGDFGHITNRRARYAQGDQ